MPHPTLDTRTFRELLDAITTEAVTRAPSWTSRDRDDAGMVLAAVDAHYLELLLARLNQVPEKNLLAFLDAMGVSLLPPGAARAPLVFTLAPAAGATGFVPKGTQAATAQTETQPALLFETEADLNVARAALAAGWTIEPQADRYGARTAPVTGQDATGFGPFKGDKLFKMQRAGRLVLTFLLGADVDTAQLKELLDAIAWEAWRGTEWKPLPQPELPPLGVVCRAFTLTFERGMLRCPPELFFEGADVQTLAGPGRPVPPVTEPLCPPFACPPDKAAPAIAGGFSVTSRFIRGRLRQPITRFSETDFARILEVTSLPAGAGEPTTRLELEIRPALVGPRGVGEFVTKVGLQPLSPAPPANTLAVAALQGDGTLTMPTTFGVAAGDTVMIEDGAVTEFVTLGALPPTTPATVTVTPRLRFDHAAGTGLRRVIFPLPTVATPLLITRLAESADAGSTWLVVPQTPDLGLAAGSVVRIGNAVVKDLDVDAITARVEQLDPEGILPDLVHANTAPVDFTKPFLPFGTTPAAGDALYIASEEAFGKPGNQVTLAVEVKTPPAPKLVWEYWTGETWTMLAPGFVKDTTASFTQDGTLSFPRPKNLAPAPSAANSPTGSAGGSPPAAMPGIPR